MVYYGDPLDVLDGTSNDAMGNPQTSVALVSGYTKPDVGTLRQENQFSISTSSLAISAIATLDKALQILNVSRGNLGALSNRLDYLVTNNTNTATNIAKSISRIEDADFAAETTTLAKQQILQQAATAMLAQANASKQNILTLLNL